MTAEMHQTGPREPPPRTPRNDNASDEETGWRNESDLLLEIIEEAERDNDEETA